MASSNNPCPCEDEAPEPAPGKIENHEEIIRVIRHRQDVIGDEASGFQLVEGHWSGDDLKGRKGQQRRSASVFRRCTPRSVLESQAKAINQEPAWADDPLIAYTITETIRDMKEPDKRRELCVNTDPIPSCSTHGGIVRSSPIDETVQRSNLLDLKGRLCGKFVVQRLSKYAPAEDLGSNKPTDIPPTQASC